MRTVTHSCVSLATEAFGTPTDPPLILIMGATASMLTWPDQLCTLLAAQGLFVIRFDHRDTGASTSVPLGEASYSVEDMAGDILAIADAYGLDDFSLMGMSLGAYIAQIIALKHPERVTTLTLVSAEPLGWDGPALPHISDAFLDHFGTLAALDWSDRPSVLAFLLEIDRLSAGPAGLVDKAATTARIEQILDRTSSPASMFNHGSVTTTQDWTGRFRDIAAPTLVIHGEFDPILPHENGEALADGIPGARLVTLDGAGHELPPEKLPAIAACVSGLIHRVK
ncbi:MAG: alpha/beta hydrolase [Devosia sp.]|uniref:alpha/beta fold hydrolase n=1 Tax=Devosia sp. TaxID=1871048 RepID=UPI0033926333